MTIEKNSIFFEIYIFFVVWLSVFFVLIVFGDIVGEWLRDRFFYSNGCDFSSYKMTSLFFSFCFILFYLFLCVMFLIRNKNRLNAVYLSVKGMPIGSKVVASLVFGGAVTFVNKLTLEQLWGTCLNGKLGNGFFDALFGFFSILVSGFLGFFLLPLCIYWVFSLFIFLKGKK